jgi:hypothetical protein
MLNEPEQRPLLAGTARGCAGAACGDDTAAPSIGRDAHERVRKTGGHCPRSDSSAGKPKISPTSERGSGRPLLRKARDEFSIMRIL